MIGQSSRQKTTDSGARRCISRGVQGAVHHRTPPRFPFPFLPVLSLPGRERRGSRAPCGPRVLDRLTRRTCANLISGRAVLMATRHCRCQTKARPSSGSGHLASGAGRARRAKGQPHSICIGPNGRPRNPAAPTLPTKPRRRAAAEGCFRKTPRLRLQSRSPSVYVSSSSGYFVREATWLRQRRDIHQRLSRAAWRQSLKFTTPKNKESWYLFIYCRHSYLT